VQQLPGLLPGQQAVHGVGGDALSSVNGGGVAESGRVAHIVTRQPDGEVAAGVPHGQVALFSDVRDCPAVPVLTQSVAVRRSRRSLLLVMITSPTLARFPSAKDISDPAGE
jgi:hypothetical protein